MNIKEQMEAAVQAAKSKFILSLCNENPDKTFRALVEELDSDLVDLLMDLCPADFGAKAPTKKATKATNKRKKNKPPRYERNPNLNSDLMRWRSAQENGTGFTMGQICEAVKANPVPVRKAMEQVGGFEKHGAGPATMYIIVEVEEDLEDDADAGEVAA